MSIPSVCAVLLSFATVFQGYAQSTGLVGEYYIGTDFNQKVLTRRDERIHFSWFDRSPAPGMPSSEYSIRWTGRLRAPQSGTYKFSAKVDDGIRLWVGGKKLIDAWQPNDWGEFEGSIDLQTGQFYDLRVDYYNGILEGEIQLYWSVPGEGNVVSNFFKKPFKPIEAQYFAPPVSSTPTPKPQTTQKPATKPAPQPLIKKPVEKPKAKPAEKPADKPVEAPVEKPKPVETPKVSEAELAKQQKALELKPIYFVQSTDEILSHSKIALDDWARWMQQKPDAQLDIKGHTDDLGNPDKNMELSERRANLVADYLVQQGVDKNRLRVRAYGGTQPLYVKPINEKERALNRRVEIWVRRVK